MWEGISALSIGRHDFGIAVLGTDTAVISLFSYQTNIYSLKTYLKNASVGYSKRLVDHKSLPLL